MKRISILLIIIGSVIAACCQFTDEEVVVNIKVHGYVKDKLTDNPLQNCSIYITNGYIVENDEYATSTDSSGYYEFNKDVWKQYTTMIEAVYPDINYKLQSKNINNNKDNEVNFYLEKY